MKMNNFDVIACINTFSQLCDETDSNELVSAEECQYWVFEAGYKAAMNEMMKTIAEGKTENLSSLANLPEAIMPENNNLTLH